MSQKKITENFLAKKIWWWRRGAKKHSLKPWPHGSFAFNYELVRRVYRDERFAPFSSLKAPYRDMILGLCDDKLSELPSRPATEPERQTEPGWTHGIHIQWNLKLPNYTLQKAFQQLIDMERKRQKIRKPRPNKGKRNRGLSGRWLELMDIADLTDRVFNDAERSSLRQARIRAKQKAKEFNAAIERFLEAKRTMTKPLLVHWVDLFSLGITNPWKGVWPRELP